MLLTFTTFIPASLRATVQGELKNLALGRGQRFQELSALGADLQVYEDLPQFVPRLPTACSEQ
jgi:hypothetical protein